MRAHDLIVTKDYGTGEAIIQARIVKEDTRHALALSDELRGKEIDLEIKAHRNRRSLDANAYAWVLINRIAEKIGQSPTAVYRSTIRDVAGNSDPFTMKSEVVDKFIGAWQKHGLGWIAEVLAEAKTPGYTHVVAYYGSSVYDTAQMARLIDLLIEDCKELEIEYLPPREIERMLSKWG
mgnify:CR=1 FL=1